MLTFNFIKSNSFFYFMSSQAVRDEALKINPDETYWNMARVSAVLVGNHELLQANSRWAADHIDPSSTLTFAAQSSLIDLLQSQHSLTPHLRLGVTYSQVVGIKANRFISFAYADNFIELVDALEAYLDEHVDLDPASTYFWFDMLVNNQWTAAVKGFDWWATTFRTGDI